MSGIKPADRKRPDSDEMFLLQCACPPGQPLRFMWLDKCLLQEMPSAENVYALSFMRELLQYVYPDEGEDG
jgi:hypothetical protein